MSGRAIAGGLELSCTFAEGSQAQSCIMTLYRILENGMDGFIMNVLISRVNPQTNRRVLNLDLGEYFVRDVAEVESDGQVTFHNQRYNLLLLVTKTASATTSESTVLTPGFFYSLLKLLMPSTCTIIISVPCIGTPPSDRISGSIVWAVVGGIIDRSNALSLL